MPVSWTFLFGRVQLEDALGGDDGGGASDGLVVEDDLDAHAALLPLVQLVERGSDLLTGAAPGCLHSVAHLCSEHSHTTASVVSPHISLTFMIPAWVVLRNSHSRSWQCFRLFEAMPGMKT